MIGTSREILLYLSYFDDIKKVLALTPERLRLLRSRLSKNDVSEDYIIDMLTRVGCRCIRPKVILPCIVKDHNGRLFDEYSFVKMFFTPEIAKRYNVDYRCTIAKADMNQSIDRAIFKHVLKKRRAWIVLDNMVLDSVWSYEPIEINFTRDKVIQVRNMLATSVPASDNPRDVLTYQRMHPVLWRPDEAHSDK